jgi:pimeloyl-ACP methyl ester carboxylesterase
MADPLGGVVLLHGHGRTGHSMRGLANALKRAGYATLAPHYPARRAMGAIVERLQPDIAAFEATFDGPVHMVTHSLGGLVARALFAARPSERAGRVVMLAPPNAGSELADLLIRLRMGRLILGRIGSYLRTGRSVDDEKLLGPVDFDLGIIAGDRALDPVFPRLLLPLPNDGKVAVAATRIAGMSDHIILPVSHTLMVYDRRVRAQTLAFLDSGAFNR